MTLEEKVGLTITFLLFLLIGGLFLTRDFNVRRNRAYYEAVFEGPVNVRKGDVVTVLGVPMGRVSDVRIEDNKVVLTFYTERYKLNEGSNVILETVGLLGQVRLLIIPGDGKPVPRNYRFQGIKTRSYDDLVRELLNLSDTLVSFLGELRTSMKELKPVISNLDRALVEVDKTLRGFRDTALVAISQQNENLTVVLKRLDTVLIEADSTMKILRKNPLLANDTLYSKIDSVFDMLRSISQEFKKGVEIKAKLKLF
ncbi:MAG: MlaD family protein [candidate division WOR-3 bacterium]